MTLIETRIINLVRAGECAEEIVNTIGCSRAYVYKTCQKQGIRLLKKSPKRAKSGSVTVKDRGNDGGPHLYLSSLAIREAGWEVGNNILWSVVDGKITLTKESTCQK